MSTKTRSLILDPQRAPEHTNTGARLRAKGEADGVLPVVPQAGAVPAAQPLPCGQRCAVHCLGGAWCHLHSLSSWAWPQMLPTHTLLLSEPRSGPVPSRARRRPVRQGAVRGTVPSSPSGEPVCHG